MKLGSLLKEKSGQEWIKPKFYEFLVRKSQRDFEDDAALAAIASDVMTRPIMAPGLGFSGSGLGTCRRAQMLKVYKSDRPAFTPELLNIFENGHYVHLKHQVAGLYMGYLTSVEDQLPENDYKLRGVMDGICSDGVGVEYKSINSYGFSSVSQFGGKHEHLMQVTAYSLVSGIETFRLLYEDKNTQKMQEFQVERTDKYVELIEQEFEVLNHHLAERTLPEVLPECLKKEGRYKTCLFASNCMAIHRKPKSLTILTSSLDSV